MAKGLNPKILHRHVSIRRAGKVVRNVLAQSLISNIKQGKLQKTDLLEKMSVIIDDSVKTNALE